MEITLTAARRAAVQAQLLSAPRPKSIVKVVEHLGRLQLDPTAVVARAEQLVLWSRLGRYEVANLDRALYTDRTLFEYAAWIIPATELDLYREAMCGYMNGPFARHRYVRQWVSANAAFRRYILSELRRRGPLRSRDIEDRATMSWQTSGWNDGKNVGRMLDEMWFSGDIAIVNRDGGQRVWDLATRWYPRGGARIKPAEVVRRRVDSLLRAWGIARAQQIRPEWREGLRELVGDGSVHQVRVAGVRGDWYLHSRAAEARRFSPRTTLLSPFDQLIADRVRTVALFDFEFKLEIYVPPNKRQFGYYVLPILHGDRLIGRIDPIFDRRSGTLQVRAVYGEPGAPDSAGTAIARAIADLARWIGAKRIDIAGSPTPWESELRRIG